MSSPQSRPAGLDSRAETFAHTIGAEKAHKRFQHKLLVPHPQHAQIWAPRKKFMCLISWERRKKGTHINFFRGILGFKNGGPKQAIFGHKKFSLLFFPALIYHWGQNDYIPFFFVLGNCFGGSVLTYSWSFFA